MFLCKDCIEPAAKFEFQYKIKSKGACECCGYTDMCVDTRAGINRDWKAAVQATLDRLGITQSSYRYHNKNDATNTH